MSDAMPYRRIVAKCQITLADIDISARLVVIGMLLDDTLDRFGVKRGDMLHVFIKALQANHVEEAVDLED